MEMKQNMRCQYRVVEVITIERSQTPKIESKIKANLSLKAADG